MNEERITALALMHINYDKAISLDEVVDIIAKLHPRRLQIENHTALICFNSCTLVMHVFNVHVYSVTYV